MGWLQCDERVTNAGSLAVALGAVNRGTGPSIDDPAGMGKNQVGTSQVEPGVVRRHWPPTLAALGGRVERVDLGARLAMIHEHWRPQVVATLNGQEVKLVKFQGEFVWHKHELEDELFLCLDGEFRMEFRDRVVALRAGECIVVPRGVEHRPVAEREVAVLLFEPAGLRNTGDVLHPTLTAPASAS